MTRNVVVLNAGSSSVKFAVAQNRRIVLRGFVEHFGRQARIHVVSEGRRRTRVANVPDLRSALVEVRRVAADYGIKPDIIAHRIVHGGKRFSKPMRLTPSVIQYLKTLADLAPLHQPANLLGVSFAKRVWPKALQWGVFDTAIYRSLPEHARTYAIPRRLATLLAIERYGFHGTSHAWVFRQGAKKLRKPLRSFSAVTIHLGAGASMTLWQNGVPVDTTMGFTPLEGLTMLTRSGDIDPAIPLYIQSKLGWSAERVKYLLEHESGLFGLCGLKDMRDILGAIGKPVAGWPRRKYTAAVRARARLALGVYTYRIRRYLAAYLGLSSTVQAIVFTGPISGKRIIRQMILRDLPAARGIRTFMVPTDEEQAIVDAVAA
ncbi:MAG: acetate kinase [Candidatus Kerfeldbacteria bacterium]